MELVWLQDFLALSEEKSFSRAAEVRNVTQPAFSRRVRSLEDWVGAPLFTRTHQGAVLTPAGLAFSTGAEDLLRRSFALRDRACEAGSLAGRALQFAATQTLSFTFFPHWIRLIGEKLELGQIQLNAGNMASCEQIMAQGGAQFLLCHHHGAVEPPFAGRFPSLTVGADDLVAVSAPDAAGGPAFVPGEAPIPYLAYSAESGLGRIIAACEPQLLPALSVEIVFQSHLAAALLSVAREGGGMAWLPRSLVEADLLARRLVLCASDLAIPVEIRLFRPAEPLAPSAEAFWNHLIDDGKICEIL